MLLLLRSSAGVSDSGARMYAVRRRRPLLWHSAQTQPKRATARTTADPVRHPAPQWHGGGSLALAAACIMAVLAVEAVPLRQCRYLHAVGMRTHS